MTYVHEYEEAKVDTRGFCNWRPERALHVESQAREYIARRGLRWDLATRNGWYGTDTAMDSWPRVVIPATSRLASNRYWQARCLLNDSIIKARDIKRYQSPFAPRGDAIVVVWPDKLALEVTVALVEGPMDALAAAGSGAVGIGLMGVTPSVEVIDHVKQLIHAIHGPLRAIADLDAVPAMARVLSRLNGAGSGNVKLNTAYPYKDLAAAPDLVREHLLR